MVVFASLAIGAWFFAITPNFSPCAGGARHIPCHNYLRSKRAECLPSPIFAYIVFIPGDNV